MRHRRGDHRPLWLGHERLETTHHYVGADLQLKERARRKLDPLGQGTRRFKADSSLVDLPLGRRRASPSAACHKMRIWSWCANYSGGGCANWRRFPQEGCGRVDEGIAAFDAAGGGHQERPGPGAGRGTRACHGRRRLPSSGSSRRRRGNRPSPKRRTPHRYPICALRRSANSSFCRRRGGRRGPRPGASGGSRPGPRQVGGGASRGRDDVAPGGGGRAGRDQEGGRHERLGRAGGLRRPPPSSGRASSTRHAPAAGGRGRRSRPGTMPGRVTVRRQRSPAARPARPQDPRRRIAEAVSGPPPRSSAGNGRR